MARDSQHPKAEPHLWPVIAMGAILAAQVGLLQVAVNRLEWGLYAAVFSPAVGVLTLSLAAWLLFRQLDREKL